MKQKIIEIHANNAQFQLLEAAMHNRNKRLRQGFFFIEGVKAVNLALQCGWPLEGAVCPRERALSAWAKDVLARVPLVYRLPDALMAQLSQREESSELMLMGRIQAHRLADLPPDKSLYLLLDRPMNPGNLGTIIRTADAFNAGGLIISGHAADIYDPQTLRASIGTLLTLPIARIQGPGELQTLREKIPGLRLVGTSAKGPRSIMQEQLKGPVLLMMGNETDGLSRAYKDMSDALVTIPIHGAASSLNLAAATAICLYEAMRQNNENGGEPL